MTIITECPVCNHKEFRPFLQCQDYTVSRETFQLNQCQHCLFIITSPRPDSNDIGSYYISDDYISHTNQAASLIDRIYLLARKYTLNWKLKLINQYALNAPGKSLLDYGCGTGAFINHCRNHGWKTTGVEPSASAREMASAHSSDDTVHANLTEITESHFDAITLWHVLEHVQDLDQTLQKLRSLLKENGTMFIAVPNHMSWDGNLYKDFWAGYDVPRHLWHFSQSTMNLLLQKNNLKLLHTIPMKLDAFYISLLSEKYRRKKSSLSGMIKAFFNGINSNQRARKNNDYSSLIYVVKK